MTTPKAGRKKRASTNHVAEWFGHRVFPVVAGTERALTDQMSRRCPFLTDVTGRNSECVKDENSKGVCTISSHSNKYRQDWLVCPIRALDDSILDDAVRRLFGHRPDADVDVVPVPVLADPQRREEFRNRVISGKSTVAYFQTKLGGEISISATARSPEFSFDSTMVEVIPDGEGGIKLGRYGIFEIQTMDYHGTYRHAVANLRDGLRLHGNDFHAALASKPEWVADRIEGPNLSNVFKRTFYQMMFKFQIGAHAHSAGCVFAIPRAVWESWQRHLGAPELVDRGDGTWQLGESNANVTTTDHPPAWIYVFDVDVSEAHSPNRIDLWRIIATDARSMSHYALDVAPAAALADGGSVDRLMLTIRARLAQWLPEISAPSALTPRD